jgi:hypothetical protein
MAERHGQGILERRVTNIEFSNSPGNATETPQKGMIVVESGVIVWSRIVPEYAKAGFSPAEFHFIHMPSTPTDKYSNGHGEARDDCRSVFGSRR